MRPMPANLSIHRTTTLLDKLFRFLNREGVDFCVLGDTTGYPESISGDVDLSVYPADFQRMESLLRAFCGEAGIKLVQAFPHEQTACAYIIAEVSTQKPPEFLMIDVCSDFYRNGNLLLTVEELMNYRRASACGRFNIPSPAFEFIYYLIKKIGKQDLTQAHGAYLSNVFAKDPKTADAQIHRFWSGRYADALLEAACSNHWENILQQLPDFLKRMRFSAQHKGFGIKDCYRKLSRIVHPTGLFVVFLGPDGSGKSTVIKEVMGTMEGGFRRTRVFHLRPRLTLKRSVIHSAVTEPHGQLPRSIGFSMAKVLYFWLDYTLGFLLHLRWLLVRSTLLIFDRYYYDLLVDPKRFRYQGSKKLVQWMGHIIPKPDIVILLDAPTEVLQSRKQEVSPEETERQRLAFLEMVQCLPNGHIIDVSKSVDNVIRETEQILLTHMEDRLKKRFGYH